MLSLIFSVVFIILKVKANDTDMENPVVRLLYYSNDGNERYTVWKDKPLNIFIENGYPRHVRCRSRYADTKDSPDFIPSTEFSNDLIAKLSVKNVSAAMSTRWACTVLKNYQAPGTPYPYKGKQYTPKDLFFNLHVKGAKAVILSAHNRSLTFVTTNLSVNYDGEASYTYVEGEDLEISCKKADLDSSALRLEYYNASGILLFQTKSREKKAHLFRIVLKSDNNNYYLDCIRATENPRREYRYRTTFLKKKEDLQTGADPHAMILSVNGQELTTVFHKDSSYDDYIFRYIDGGQLNVTCRKNDNIVRGTLSFFSNTQILPAHRSESRAVISVDTPTSNLTNKTVICSINNTEVRKPNARILFLHDELGHDVHIQGLPTNNIMYQYTNSENQWTIEYQYTVNETLNLTCVLNTGFQMLQRQQLADADFFQWKFEGKSYDSPANNLPSNPSRKWSQQTFTKVLDATHNTTKFRCIYFPLGRSEFYVNRSVDLIFRLKPDLGAGAAKDENTAAEEPKVPIVPIAISVGAAIGIITMICLVLWRKRTKRTHLIESEYDNLSNQNDSPIPAFPSQWETNCDDSHYAKIDEEVMEENDAYTTDTDKLYRMPYKRQSNISENHYTEIDDYFRPKPTGLAVNWNSAHPSNFNKEKDSAKGTPLHKSNNPTQNNICDSKQGTYDKLRYDNVPINKSNENYSNVQKTGKSKTVTFRQMSNDLRPDRNHSEETSRQHCESNDRRFKQNSDGHYANVSKDIYMQPGNLRNEPNYENHFLQSEKSVNNVYAEPYGELGISCKKDFFG